MVVTGNIITADEGMALHRKGTATPTTITRVSLSGSDSYASWEDCEYGEPKQEAEAMKYSTLSIKRELAKLGKWDAAKALIERSGAWDDYVLANYLGENDPVFVAAKAAFVAAGILTADELAELLPKCVWTAEWQWR